MAVKRFAPLAGIVFVVLAVFAIIGLGGDTPSGDDSAAKIEAFYQAHHGRQSAAAYVLAIAVLFLAIFGAAAFLELRGGRAGVGDIVFVIGTAVAGAGFLISASIHLALSEGVHDHISPVATQAINSIDSYDYLTFTGLGIMLIGAAVTMIPRPGALRWLGWIGLVGGIAIYTPAGFIGFAVSGLWIIATAIVLVWGMRRSVSADPA